MKHFSTYFKALQSYNLTEITEHSLRPELKDFLTSIANEVDDKIKILHEGKREGKFGAPDFKITRTEAIIGYVENRKIGENLKDRRGRTLTLAEVRNVKNIIKVLAFTIDQMQKIQEATKDWI